MAARTKSEAGNTDRQQDAGSQSDRNDFRYRFAKLLLNNEFEKALDEALVAYSQGRILKEDMAFVVYIVKAAERMGKTKIDQTRIPPELQMEGNEEASVGLS